MGVDNYLEARLFFWSAFHWFYWLTASKLQGISHQKINQEAVSSIKGKTFQDLPNCHIWLPYQN